MNEKSSKRREWVKTAAIVFLSVLLVLTFFSQTIMNHSLPEVATKFAQSGSITSKIRGGGTVESGDPYTVEIAPGYVGRKVTSIHFKVGDTVKKGDVLFTVAEGDGSDLEEAKSVLEAAESALKTAQNAYDEYILSESIKNSDINNAKAGTSAATYRKMITELQTAVSDAEAKAAQMQAAYDQFKQLIDDCNTQLGLEANKDSVTQAKVATAETIVAQKQAIRDDAKTAAEDAQKAKDAAALEGEALEAAYLADPDSIEDIEAERAKIADKLATATTTLSEKTKALETAEDALKKAQEDLANAVKEKEAQEASTITNNVNAVKIQYEASLHEYEKKLADANAEKDAAEKKLNELLGTISKSTKIQELDADIASAKKKVADAKKKVDDLSGENKGSEITSDVNGTIISINITSGKKIEMRDVMTMQPEGQGYFMTMSVTNEQARLVSVGDKASLVNSWYYNDMDITLQSIKPDRTDPAKKKMLTFAIDGNAVAGQTLNISIGQKSQNYDCIIPKSALRNDTNGDYVLIVESKSTPLGNRYIATRVDVQVLAEDDTQVAVSGAINGWGDYVITTASAPIKAGSQVRMTEN
ncbi:MAG: biotin/lipoyl-binding protein [Lachnospiraceae bacterium]|nr:biotin/lipoyl-binding protein [Lachnospiraceae bacterium]